MDGVHSAGGFVQPLLQVRHLLLVQVCLLGKVGLGGPLRLEQLLEGCAVLTLLLAVQHTPPQLTAQCAMGVVLLPRHTAEQGVEFSVHDLTDFQALWHVQHLSRLCHCHNHQCSQVWPHVLVKLDQFHQRHFLGQRPGHIEQQGACWLPAPINPTWHQLHPAVLTFSQHGDRTQPLHQEGCHILRQLTVSLRQQRVGGGICNHLGYSRDQGHGLCG